MSEEFEKWYTEVYLPEQTFEPTQKEKSGIRFAFEEGLNYRQVIDAENNRVCIWNILYKNDNTCVYKTECNELTNVNNGDYCLYCGGKIEEAE